MNEMASKSCVMVTVFIAAGSSGLGGDWSQYRGDKGDGISGETVPSVWSGDGPKRLWTATTAAGFSSMAVADGKATTLVNREVDGRLGEVCLALDAATGKELWAA